MFVKCKKCGGRGYLITVGVGMGNICPVCNGKCGFEIPEDKILCPQCLGKTTQTVKMGYGISFECTCDKCFGTGYIDKPKT